jgi:8-oxo-dGTP pyrophosphatase MutT (NUDIX family)
MENNRIDQTKEKIWRLIDSDRGPDLILFKTRFDWLKNPRNGSLIKAIVLEAPDWVDVVAMTPEKKIVVVCQYRFGIGKTTVEIPAGIMEEGETPEQAVLRELREETGYTTESLKYLGWVEANPAFMTNICHQWLALNVTKTDAVDMDVNEDIEIKELSIEEIRHEIKSGRMRNSFTLLALSRVVDLRAKLKNGSIFWE